MSRTLKQRLYSLLRWSERYTKTDMVYLTRGGFWMTLRQTVVAGTGLVVAVAFANLLPKEVFGGYKYILSVTNILVVFTLSGLNDAVTRSIARGYEGTLERAFSTKLLWGLGGTLVGAVMASYYFFQGNSELGLAFTIASVFIPLRGAPSLYKAYWKGKKRFDVLAGFVSAQELIAVAIIIPAALLTNSLLVILLAYFGAAALTSMIFYRLAEKKVPAEAANDTEAAALGGHLSVIGVLGRIAGHIDSIIIWHLLGPAAVAVYAFAIKMPSELRRFITQAFPIALPKFSERSTEEIKRTLLGKIAKLYLVLIPLTVLYVIAAPELYQLLFPQYMEAVWFSQVFALTILFAPLELFGMVFKAHHKTVELYLSSAIAPLIKIVALAIYVPLYGIMGAIGAILISLVFNAVAQLIMFRRI